MSYLDLAEALVKRLEGLRLVGYADTGGVPTNGYGHTGPEVKIGGTITQEIADHNLSVDLATADTHLSKVCPAVSDLMDHQRAALVSFVFNLGANPAWTIWKDIANGNLADVPAQLRRFDHGEVDGKLVEIPGLRTRREAEITFWNTADLAQAAATPPRASVASAVSSGFTRAIPTPPTPLPAPPLAKASITTKVVTAVGAGAAAVGTYGSQVHDIVAPHASEGHIFAMVAEGATGLVVIAAIVGLLIHARQSQQRTV